MKEINYLDQLMQGKSTFSQSMCQGGIPFCKSAPAPEVGKEVVYAIQAGKRAHHHHGTHLVLQPLNEELHRRLQNHVLIIMWAPHLLTHATYLNLKLYSEVEEMPAGILCAFWEAAQKSGSTLLIRSVLELSRSMCHHVNADTRDMTLLFTASALAPKL